MKRSKVTFNWDSHFIDPNEKDHVSALGIVKLVTTPFPYELRAESTYKKHHNNPESQYYGMSKLDIINCWLDKMDVSVEYGKQMDDYIGISLSGDIQERRRVISSFKDDPRMLSTIWAFETFINDLYKKYPDIELVAREQPVAYPIDDKFFFNGRFDALFYIPSKCQFILVDWKAAKDLSNDAVEFFKPMLGPMKKYPDNSLHKYVLQTMIYRKILQDMYINKELDPSIYTIKNFVVNLGKKGESDKCPYQIFGNDIIEFDDDLLNEVFDFAKEKYYKEGLPLDMAAVYRPKNNLIDINNGN